MSLTKEIIEKVEKVFRKHPADWSKEDQRAVAQYNISVFESAMNKGA